GPDLGVSGPAESPGCSAPVWSVIPPADLTTVQSLKFDFGNMVLQPQDAVKLTWPMRAPLGGTVGEIAWNSFGFRARRVHNSTFLPPDEPIKVGIQRQANTPAMYGDYVWQDTNQNGIQDAGEIGINGVRVELYQPGADNTPGTADDVLVGFTATGPDSAGN